MILDGHIHMRDASEGKDGFPEKLRLAGVAGALLISLPPPVYRNDKPPLASAERMNNVLAWCGGDVNLFPFYWIDPLETDAAEQVALAVQKGIRGFKIICDRYFPGDPRAMPVYAAIAAAGRPILFHSGILWDGRPSSQYNRPAAFEALLEIDGLRFSLAHISWPWCDECIALYGKFLNARSSRRGGSAVEMFIDVTPGTPPIYRREALTRLFTVGYDIADNVFFGSDSCVNQYNVAWVKEWVARDTAIFAEIGLAQGVREAVFCNNLRRFVGLAAKTSPPQIPRSGM